ncbi:uncharacterized protein LOC127239577 [Andrographis paniculata]|uniref:uncharacterized protein LOC127239577 n=1 Tax=Andrographis paniculata TaxID=175694 RepID=UPI0021E6E07A|nr:uncharacterized protein LOC127239577 [Andrographis paniculata]
MSISSLSLSDSSDEELENICQLAETYAQLYQKIEHINNEDEGSSRQRRRRTYIERNREDGHTRLFNDYFSDNPVYPSSYFRRRFRMRKHVFLRIVDRLSNEMEFFQQRRDATGRDGLSALQKCTAAIRVLAYGTATDTVDEYLRLGESTTRACLKQFVEGICSLFGEEYLRRPNSTDVQRLLFVAETRGFPGMLGSIDCMHWEWKNYPAAWKGQFERGDHGKPTVILEAVASYDLWIWHAFFGTPGTCNDINVLDRSPVFNDVLNGRAPEVNFVINNHQYNMGYYLTDGIYPPWATFVQSIRLPQGYKAQLFAQHQEAVRKYVERAFGVLQARFAFIKTPSLIWDINLLGKIMRACIILHNMIVEDERDTYVHYYDTSQYDQVETNDNSNWSYNNTRHATMDQYLRNRMRLRARETHHQLKADLVEHIWEKFGQSTN